MPAWMGSTCTITCRTINVCAKQESRPHKASDSSALGVSLSKPCCKKQLSHITYATQPLPTKLASMYKTLECNTNVCLEHDTYLPHFADGCDHSTTAMLAMNTDQSTTAKLAMSRKARPQPRIRHASAVWCRDDVVSRDPPQTPSGTG